MEILGYTKDTGLQDPDLKTLICRNAWEILQAFGDEMNHDIEIGREFSSFDYEDGRERFECSDTEFIKFGDSEEYSALFDQFPTVDGKICTDLGFVALHISRYDVFEDVEQEQQIVFRQETHYDGTCILFGDNDELVEVESYEDLVEVATFLEFIRKIGWNRFAGNPFSRINLYPQSELLQSISAMLTDDEDDM